MILGYQLSRLVRVLAIALTGWPLPRLSAQTNRLDVLLVGGRVMVLAVALALMAQAAVAQSPLFDSHVHLWNGEESLLA